MTTCGAKTRSGTPCRRPAGWGTDHPSQGRCKLHGGATPIKHGRYSKITRPRIKELLDELEHDPDPLDLTPELKLLRALVQDYVERYDHLTEALHAWHNSFGSEYRAAYEEWRETVIKMVSDFTEHEPSDLPSPPDPNEYENKPRQVIDILSVGKYIGEIGRLVERIEKVKAEGSISLETLDRVLEQLGVEVVQAAQEAISDATARTTLLRDIERRWGSIRLEPTAARARVAPGARVVN